MKPDDRLKAKFTTEVKDIQEQIELKEIKSNNGKEYQLWCKQ